MKSVRLAIPGTRLMAGTHEERLAMVMLLSRLAWVRTGKPFPSYTRSTMPIRITKLSEQGNED